MDNLWHIDKNPTPQISLEDGELVGDDDNELNNKIKNDAKINDNKNDKLDNNLKDKNDIKQKTNKNSVKDIKNDNQKNRKQIKNTKFNMKNDQSGNQYSKNLSNEFDTTQFDKLSNDQLKDQLRTHFERVKAIERPHQMNNDEIINNPMINNQMNNQFYNPIQNNHHQQHHQFRNMQFNSGNQFNQMPMDFINPINQHMNRQMNSMSQHMNQHMNYHTRMPNQLQHNRPQFNHQQQQNQVQFNSSQNRSFDPNDRKKFVQIDRNYKKLSKKLSDDDSKTVDQSEMIEMLKEMHFLLSKYKSNNSKNFNNKKRELIDKKNDKQNKKFKPKQNQQINLHKKLQEFDIEVQSNAPFDAIITTDSFNNNQFKNNKFNHNDKIKKKFNQKTKKSKKINEVCKYYVQDFCVNGDECNYLHKEFPCKFYHLFNSCSQDEYNCKFSHQPLTEDMKKLLDNFVQRNQDIKDFKQDKVLLGDATITMKNSLNTWEWQQEICKLHQRKTEDQNKELFRISDEFLMQNKPLDLSKKSFYTQNNDQNNLNIKKDDSDQELDPDELVALEEIRLIEEENERKEKEEKARKLIKTTDDQELKNELFEPPVQKISNNNKELYQRREDLLNKENNLFNNKYDNKLEELIKLKNNDHLTSFEKNFNLYKSDSKLDCKTNLLCSSDFLNRLADETKINNETKSNKLDDQFSKLFNENNDNKKEQNEEQDNEQIKEQIKDDNEIDLNNKTDEEKEEEIRMTNNLIDEIMRKNNSIISPQSPNSSRQNSLSDKVDNPFLVSLSDDYVQISNQFDEYCSQKNLFENLSILSNEHSDDDTAKSNNKVTKIKITNDEQCIISRSDDDDFEFKLFICEFEKSKSLERYEKFYLYDEKAKFDPRLYKYFSSSNVFRDIKINDQSLNSILSQTTDYKSNSSINFFSLSNLSNLRKMKNDDLKND